ncbi:NUDIX hydrolase domain-like protein [Dimargaris cristalligena]|uniref:NUDIX hydrolase domain-like protein n=1 Tax=Dimargaris cristalligena TaxID=215637 RepID=A0A4P9ZX57_9FUNG|nr:NUDIX hydrolase domain-like protein [Dimargaris cristalligena]|eukprot:RKP38217.1 NUDIX hydrolase domain-like protein [Dimargaris cristalligena]
MPIPSFDFERVHTLATQLRTHSPTKLPSNTANPRRASVAIIIRARPHQVAELALPYTLVEYLKDDRVRAADFEVLYIRRAISPTDRWSGQVAFPGGRREPGESDQQAAERETREEIGLDLHTSNYAFLGALDDRTVHSFMGRTTLLVLCPFATPPLLPQPTEVASVHWISFGALLANLPHYHGPTHEVRNHPSSDPVAIDYARRLLPTWLRPCCPLSNRVLHLLSGYYHFHCLTLLVDALSSHYALPSLEDSQPLRLWGLTLQMTSDLVDTTFPPDRLPAVPLSGPLPVFEFWDVKAGMYLWQRWNQWSTPRRSGAVIR